MCVLLLHVCAHINEGFDRIYVAIDFSANCVTESSVFQIKYRKGNIYLNFFYFEVINMFQWIFFDQC